MVSARTACMIVIGNEILSGRTQDANLHWLAQQLRPRGIRLMEARVIPDIEEIIVSVINMVRSEYDYVFTTGGIGPTHDDITSACIARAFGVPCTRHPDAVRLLRDYYHPEPPTDARLKMAEIPEGARLIPNPVSAAPGFQMQNVYVMAGVPKIFQAMFNAIAHELDGGEPILSESLILERREGDIAALLTEIQKRFPDLEIGSYPFARTEMIGTVVVFSGIDKSRIDAAVRELKSALGIR